MSDTLEAGLRKAMEALGRVVESLIGKAKRAKVQVSTRSGMQPILSLDSQIAVSRVRDLIELATQKVLGNSIPDLKGGVAIEVGEGPAVWGSRLLSAKAKMSVSVEIGGGSIGRQGDFSRGYVVRGSLIKLPFADGHFSYFLARLATTLQGDFVRAARELSRVLKPSGQGVIVDYHPFGLFTKRGSHRMRPPDSGVQRFEDYYRLFRQAGLRVVDVREAFVDEGMRQFFKDDEISAYRNLKGTPLLIFLFVYKPKG